MKSWDVRIYGPCDKLDSLNKFIENNYLGREKEIIFEYLKDKFKDSLILNIIRDENIIRGRGKLLNIVKENGLSESEFLNELQKLIFCGLIREEVVKVRGIFRYDYTLNER